MKIYSLIALLFFSAIAPAQKIPVRPFLKWHTNNAPDCKNVVLTKDSVVLPVKNKCRTEGQLENWRPSVDISEGLKFKVPAGAKVQLTIIYKFTPAGDDIFRFGGQFNDTGNTDDQLNGTLRTAEDEEHILPASATYNSKILLVTFSDETSNPVFKAPKASAGELTFDFSVSNTSGQTHQGSKAVIKSVSLEVIQ